MNTIEIRRLPAVLSLTGDSRTTLYTRVKQGLFPRPVKLGVRAMGWPVGEVNAINAARVAGKSQDEIRALVALLESNRRAAA